MYGVVSTPNKVTLPSAGRRPKAVTSGVMPRGKLVPGSLKTVVVAVPVLLMGLLSGVEADTTAVLTSVSTTAGALTVTVIGAAAPTARDGIVAVIVPLAWLIVQPAPLALW